MQPPCVVLTDASALAEGASVRFRFLLDDVLRDAFAVRWQGEVYAYVDSCRHQARSLSYGDGQVLDAAEGLLVCRHHGARYVPRSGLCIEGPCRGAQLTALALRIQDGALWCMGRLTPHPPGTTSPHE
ncbi:MAG: Rieske 2Fe-2S domain-containing protein [Candidatus Eisenbacteria bacterium]